MNKSIFIVFSLCFFPISVAYSTPAIDPEFNETYQSWLESTVSEKLSPRTQNELGIVPEDIICFESRIPMLKITSNDYVACVYIKSAKVLEDRGWGIQKSTKYDNSKSPLPGLQCWDVYFKQLKPSTSQIVKDTRLSLLNLSEKYAWKSIWIEDKKENQFLISTPHLHDEEITQLITLLESKDSISKVIFREYSCNY